MKKQAYKLKIPKNSTIYGVFYVLLLKQDITKNEQEDKITLQLEFNKSYNNKKYKVERIYDNIVFTKESKSGY